MKVSFWYTVMKVSVLGLADIRLFQNEHSSLGTTTGLLFHSD
jgi:hypothetical protein